MITVTLLQAGLGIPFGVDEHPRYMDYELRDDQKTTTSSQVDIAEENAIAPLIARLGGARGIDTYPDLTKAHDRLLAKHKNREDGIRLVTMLLSWVIRWPNGTWEITGRNLDVVQARGDHFGIDPVADAARFSTDSVTTTNQNARFVGIFDAQSEPVEAIIMRPEADITIEDAMRPDITIARGGGSKSGRIRRDRPTTVDERNRRREAELKEDGLRPAMVGARVSYEVRDALTNLTDQTGDRVTIGRLLETVGTAILQGRTYEDVVSALSQERAS